jgi:L-iditol 2-dehydrogenase
MEWMAEGKIRVAPLITAVAPLDDGPSWFARLYAREPHLMKVVLDPRQKDSRPTDARQPA